MAAQMCPPAYPTHAKSPDAPPRPGCSVFARKAGVPPPARSMHDDMWRAQASQRAGGSAAG
eukprot:gene5809-7391_t